MLVHVATAETVVGEENLMEFLLMVAMVPQASATAWILADI
jgi:hypothetical protein